MPRSFHVLLETAGSIMISGGKEATKGNKPIGSLPAQECRFNALCSPSSQ